MDAVKFLLEHGARQGDVAPTHWSRHKEDVLCSDSPGDRFHFWRALLARIIVLGGMQELCFLEMCLCRGFRDKLGNTSLHVIPLYADETTPGFWCRRWSRG